MKQSLLFFLMLAFLVSCEKDNPPSSYEEQALEKCIASSAANNPKSPGAEYARFNLNGRDIIFSDGYDGYKQFNNIAMTFTTSGPVLNPGTDSSRQYLLKIGFRQPAPPPPAGQPYSLPVPESDEIFISLQKRENLSAIEFIDKYVRVGDLKLRQKPWWDVTLDPNPVWEDGFEINYGCVHCCNENDPTVGTFYFTSSSLNHNGFLRCTKLYRVDLGESVGYHIEFEFTCELYGKRLSDSEPIYEVIGDIKNGKMVVDFVVEK
ncbi:MAG: hypothetical protein KF734_02650 [Saprospiraceae bacterium]|nr:hypothetical protein [Saprospiraceae bacterium]